MGILKKISKLNIRSLILNFYLFPLNQAVHLPLLLSKSVKLADFYRGGVQINCKKIVPAMIQIGYSDVGTIDARANCSVLQISKGGRLLFNGRTHIGAGCNISVGSEGYLSFGKNMRCTGNTSFISHAKISFEDDCLVSWNCTFMDTDFHRIIKNGMVINMPSEIVIHHNSWIGCNCIVLKGAELPSDSVLGAGSLLNKHFSEENCIYAGSPAKPIVRNIEWKE